jgi:hypothetical protein
MAVLIKIGREVVVDNILQLLYMDPSGCNICGAERMGFACLEVVQSSLSLLLRHGPMYHFRLDIMTL